MVAFVSNSRRSDPIDVREPGFVAMGRELGSRAVGAGGQLRLARALAMVVNRIGRIFERRRHAEIARQNGPLSLDDAWAGEWYTRSRMLQDALLQRGCSTGAKPFRRRIDWDDKLD